MKDMSDRKKDIESAFVKEFEEYDGAYSGPFIIKGQEEKKIVYDLKCNECPLGHRFKGLPTGNLNAEYFFIGEAPSEFRAGLDIEANYVWHDGPSSKILKTALYTIGILSKSFFSNVIKCSLRNNIPRRPEEYFFCIKKFLVNELQLVQPKKIIVMGAQADKAFLSIGGDYEYRKILHPSFFIYKGKNALDYATYLKGELKI